MFKENLSKIIAGGVFCFISSQVFAVPPKTWDAIFNADGSGEYSAAKVESIKMGKYTHYKEVQPVSFTVKDSLFEFTVSGNLTVAADQIEKEHFYEKCNESKEAWISYFDKPVSFGDRNLIIEVKGVDLACGDDLYVVDKLQIKFLDPEAQQIWVSNFEGREKFKREKLIEFRKAEQEHRLEIRGKIGVVKDPRDGQMYRTIKVDGREWFAQNANYNVEGHSWCYEDNESYCNRGGRLYDLEGARQACPDGWHLPRDREWSDMLKGLTGCYDGVDKCDKFASKMKATTGWHGGGGTDEYGFSVFSSGYRKRLGKTMVKYEDMGESANFWSAQNGRNETIWIWAMGRMSDNMVRVLVPSKTNAYSVRCINGY